MFRPTIKEVTQFAAGGRDESLAVMAMARRTKVEVFECREALRETADAMRRLADITNPGSLPYVLGDGS